MPIIVHNKIYNTPKLAPCLLLGNYFWWSLAKTEALCIRKQDWKGLEVVFLYSTNSRGSARILNLYEGILFVFRDRILEAFEI